MRHLIVFSSISSNLRLQFYVPDVNSVFSLEIPGEMVTGLGNPSLKLEIDESESRQVTQSRIPEVYLKYVITCLEKHGYPYRESGSSKIGERGWFTLAGGVSYQAKATDKELADLEVTLKNQDERVNANHDLFDKDVKTTTDLMRDDKGNQVITVQNQNL